MINKSIGSLSSQDEENIIRQYSINLLKSFSIWEFMEKYRYQIVCILIFLVALTILVIVNNRHRTQMQVEAAAQEAYRCRMETDELTGLLNKEGFYQRGREFLEKHSEADARIVYINIENFKLVNDLFGEDAGDGFLKFIGLELEKIFGRIDIVSSRYEADHFVILTLDNEDRIQAKINHFCNRIRDYYLKTTVEISAGIYEIRDRSKSLRIMCDRAHLAADSIKKNHMIQVAVYDDTHRKKLIQEANMNCYRTIRETDDSVETLYEIQKSRFITHIRHVETEEEARSFIQAMKKQYFDARHNCSAYVLGERADKQKSNDDGEPGGTAGNPILEAIKKNELTDVVIVVTRYFGGIKLGAGGLIRAYGHAAVLGIEAATRIEMTPFTALHVTIGYDLLATVEHWIRQQEIRTEEADYAEHVTLHLLLPPEEVEARLTELQDLTSANFQAEKGETRRIALPC